MNNKIHILSFVLIGFLLNIFFYIFSDNYRYFLQSLKYDNALDQKINDEFKISITENHEEETDRGNDLFTGLSNDFIERKTSTSIILKDKSKYIQKKVEAEEKKVEFINSVEKIKLTDIEKKILEQFKKYNLKQIDLHPRLFDLTGEYPDEYFEYYGEEINLYFFGNKLYSDMKDIFEVLTYELPFSVNEVNNFGEKSFYINLNSGFEDDYIRVVIKKSNRIFGFKIKKQLYEQMKNNLGVIFHK